MHRYCFYTVVALKEDIASLAQSREKLFVSFSGTFGYKKYAEEWELFYPRVTKASQ